MKYESIINTLAGKKKKGQKSSPGSGNGSPASNSRSSGKSGAPAKGGQSKEKQPTAKKQSGPRTRSMFDFSVGDDGITSYSSNPGRSGIQKKKTPSDRSQPGVSKQSTSQNNKMSLLAELGGSGKGAQNGTKKAAKLLLALGPDHAASILKELKEPEIESLVLEMTAIKRITAEEKKAIIEEFQNNLSPDQHPAMGGMDAAREILTMGLGEDRANAIFSRLNRGDLRKDFHFLEQIEPEMLASALQQEHPQVAAVALSFINPRIAADVMKRFDGSFRSDVAVRIARTANTHPDAVQRVASVLKEKFQKRTEESYSDTGGAETLANILNHMDRKSEESILGTLGSQAPDLLENVRERLYTFEELISLTTRETRLLISKINDDELLASALRGAGDELRRHFFNSLSNNRAADLLDIINNRGPVTIREVNEARSYIVSLARKLDEEGTIVVKKEKEEYV